MLHQLVLVLLAALVTAIESTGHQMEGLNHQMEGLSHQMEGLSHQTKEFSHQTPGTRQPMFLVSSTWTTTTLSTFTLCYSTQATLSAACKKRKRALEQGEAGEDGEAILPTPAGEVDQEASLHSRLERLAILH